jgi:tetratricopeptide (TPR) repeat protein
MGSTRLRPRTVRNLLAGLLATLLLSACMPAQTGPDAAPPPVSAFAGVGTDRQLTITHRNLGLGLEAAGDIAGAVDEYLASLTLGDWPTNQDPADERIDTPHDDLARICGLREPEAAVVRACGRAITSFRFSSDRLVELLANRGDANFRLDNFDHALADYQTALKLETSNLRSLFGRARIRAREGDHLAALPDFRRAIDGGLDNPDTRHARALSFVALGRFEEAATDYDQVLSDPAGIAAYPDAYRDRAAAHCQLGQADAAAIGWQVWLDATPDDGAFVQEMLVASGYLSDPASDPDPDSASDNFSPAALAALRDWTKAGCPENSGNPDSG